MVMLLACKTSCTSFEMVREASNSVSLLISLRSEVKGIGKFHKYFKHVLSFFLPLYFAADQWQYAS